MRGQRQVATTRGEVLRLRSLSPLLLLRLRLLLRLVLGLLLLRLLLRVPSRSLTALPFYSLPLHSPPHAHTHNHSHLFNMAAEDQE